MANNQELQVILREALRAYEHARAAHLQAGRQATKKRNRAFADLAAAEKVERSQFEATQRRARAVAGGEQSRLGDLAAAVNALEEAARTALAQAGLAHIAGAPVALDGTPAATRRGDAKVAERFVQAQTSFVALREALYGLAAAQVDAGQWDAARQTLQPLLADRSSPLYTIAFDLERESYLRAAQVALDAGQWEKVRSHLAAWLAKHKEDEDAQTLYCESYYLAGTQALEQKEWTDAQALFEALVKYRADFRDTNNLWRASYLNAAQEALDAGEWEQVRTWLAPWLAKHKEDETAQAHYCDSYYRHGRLALEQEQWAEAQETLGTLVRYRANFRDVNDLWRTSCLNAARAALAAGHGEQVHILLAPWLERNKGDVDALVVLRASLPDWMDAVEIPAGEFRYGEQKQLRHLDAFRIARAPVTNAQYNVYVQLGGAELPAHWSLGQAPAGKEDHPVVNVSWEDAQAFCAWAGLRLPTEQEWEKAARGIDGRAYPWGNQAPSADLCNCNNIVGDTTPVGRYPKGASPYGLLDMAGNVWEWCENPHESGGRVRRGGSYANDASGVGCAFRYRGDPDARYANYGFRVVCP